MAKTLWVELLGADVRIVKGKKYRTRIAEAGAGNAETLVLIHGGGGHIESFARNIVPLGQYFRTIAMEMLWHGFSDGPPIEQDRNAQIGGQVLDLLDTLGLEKVWLLGEGAGASVVTWVALRHPERLKGIIYEGGPAGISFKPGTVPPPPPPIGGISMGERTLQLLKAPTWDAVHDRLIMVMHREHPERVTDELVDLRLFLYSRPETADAMTRYYEYSRDRGYAAATEEEIAGLDLPVLILANDGAGQVVGMEAARRAASLIPGAQLKLLKETGIWAHWEAPDEFNESVRRFIMGEKVT